MDGRNESKTDTDDEDVHEDVDVRALEFGLAAVHHQLRLPAGKDDEAVAPGRVPQDASTEKDLVVVQGEGLSLPVQRSLVLAQHVIRSLADHFT